MGCPRGFLIMFKNSLAADRFAEPLTSTKLASNITLKYLMMIIPSIVILFERKIYFMVCISYIGLDNVYNSIYPVNNL